MNKIKFINSADNEFFKELVNLSRSSTYRRKKNKTLLDGKTLVRDYANKFSLKNIDLAMSHSFFSDNSERMDSKFSLARINVIPDKLFVKFSNQSDLQGVTAVIFPYQIQEILLQPGRKERIIVVDGVQDPGNLGAVIRLAAGFNLDKIFLSNSCCDPWSPKCLRGGMGGQFSIPCVKSDIKSIVREFSGTKIALVSTGGVKIEKKKFSKEPIVFAIGAEGSGISPELEALISDFVTIDFDSRMESLNVSTSLAIVLYEYHRQISKL